MLLSPYTSNKGLISSTEIQAKIALLAQADEQDPVGKGAAHVVQQQRCAQLALHIAAADDFADITVAGTVDQLRGQRQLAIVEHSDDYASTPLLLGAAAFYGKFHRDPSSPGSAFCYGYGRRKALSANVP